MIRLYGSAPYRIVLIHGGPGAVGSLKDFAKELANHTGRGVVEALQSRYSIEELIEELRTQISENCDGAVSLVGHSWGAWLAALFAAKYPELVDCVVLVGSGPLEDKYVAEIGRRRKQHLSEEHAAIFDRLVNNRATDDDMKEIPALFAAADNHCLINSESHRADSSDSQMHNAIWSEAAAMRSDGRLLEAFRSIRAKLFLIQGADDPHPADGVILPLLENGIPCESHVLERCGHSPFMEKYARETFYNILQSIL